MNKLILFLILLSGCAHQTIHDYCVENEDHYSNYNECYAERAEARKKPSVVGAFFKGFNEGRSANQSTAQIHTEPPMTTVNCDTQGNHTTCY